MGLFALLAFAAAVRLPGIFSAPFWSDEYFSWLTATQPTFVQFFLRCTGVDVYPPLSYFPVWLIAKFSDASWALRLPSALAGIACVWVAVRMLRRYVKEGYALTLGAMIALAPLSVYLGWESKAYNFFALMNLLMMDEALLLLENPARGTKRLALWVAGSMWSFFLSPYFILSMLVAACWQDGRRGAAFKKVLKGALTGMLFALPLAPFFVKTLLLYAGSSAYNTALPLAPLYSFENFSAGFWMSPGHQFTSMLIFCVAAAAFFSGGRVALAYEGKQRNPAPAALTKMLASMAFLPPLLFLVVSAVGKPNYNDRAMLISAFAWILIGGLGALCIHGPMRRIVLATLLLTEATALIHYQIHAEARRIDYGLSWELVKSGWQEGDVVMHAYFESGLPFQYYAAREVAAGQRKEPRPNYVHQKDLGFSSDAAAQGIRGLWRRVNAWLGEHGMGVYAGTDPCFVDGPRLLEATQAAKRIWYVVATEMAARKQMMPIPNGFRGGQPLGRSFNFADEGWMRGKWRFDREEGDQDVHVYLYVPEAGPAKKKK